MRDNYMFNEMECDEQPTISSAAEPFYDDE